MSSAFFCFWFAFLLFVHFRMTGMLVGLFRAWASLATNSTFLGQYYIDYVTERFFPMFYGLTIYNLESSRVNSALGLELYLMLLYVLSVLISLGLILAFAYWICSANDRRHLALGISLAIAYTGVSLNYIFVRPYGYGAFKNATWLQFALVLFASVGIWWIYNVLRHRAAIWKKISAAIALVVVVTPFVLGNLFESWEYGMIGLGKDTDNGYMVVVHNMSGNHDYFELASAVPKIVRANESVGLALLNIAQQSWAMYYLRNLRLSYLGQYLLPGDDENLPDVKTRLVTDPYGNVTKDSPTFYHGATDDYYLVNQPRTINGEIVKNRYPSAVWENSTFKLVRASETPDFIFVARGFYRSEYRTANDYYLPQAIKWTAEGGELHILRAAQPGKPYRLAFTGLTGPGLDNARRTIEFFHNGQKFGSEKVINGFARIVSDPFYPTGTDDTIAIRIKEKVAPRPRPFSLWHRDLPIEYRKLNVMVSDIELLPPGDAPYRCNVGEDKCSVGQVLRGSDLFTQVIAFNGIEPNQWVREALTMTLPRPPGASALSLSVAVPGESTLRFPLHITVSIDGARSVHDVKEPGNVLLELPLPKHGFSEGLINLSIEPDQYFSSPNNRSGHDSTGERSLWRGVNSLLKPYVNAPAARPVVQSIRLESIGFK